MKSKLSQTSGWRGGLAMSRFNQLFLFLSFFLDGCIFPFPTTVIFIAVSLISPSRSYYNAVISVVALVAGSIAGYALGHYLWLKPDGSFTQLAGYFFDHVPGFTILNYHYIQNLFLKWGNCIIIFSVILPLPYQAYSITAGVFDFNLVVFILLTIILYGLRFLLIAWLIIQFGEGVSIILQKNMRIIVLLIILVFLILLMIYLFGFHAS